jgi:RES domain-containing protein
LRLGRVARKQLVELIAGATVLRGDFFRSVAFRYFHPDDVISGEGTRSSGGRFVPPGVRAVYASLAEETALREVTTRKNALGGRSQIAVGEYPRMTYVISVTTNRNLDLASPLPSELADVVGVCSRGPGYSASQELAKIWISEGIESAVFPSATGAGRNVAVYLANAAAGSVIVRNRDEVLAVLRRPRVRKRGLSLQRPLPSLRLTIFPAALRIRPTSRTLPPPT